MSRPREEDGYSTVITLGFIAVLLMITGVLAAAGTVVVARHRAEAVADVAALSAAQHARQGVVAACLAAGLLVREHHAQLVSCRLDGLDAVVVVGVRPPGRAGDLGTVRGRARAGRRTADVGVVRGRARPGRR
jgi:secretion/DNA translocation related TadE-like protein